MEYIGLIVFLLPSLLVYCSQMAISVSVQHNSVGQCWEFVRPWIALDCNQIKSQTRISTSASSVL